MWSIKYSKQAVKDSEKIVQSHLKDKVIVLIKLLQEDSFKIPPPYEKLVGDLTGTFSRRINIQHRLVYEVYEDEKIVRVLRIWTHYE
jgi:toxin YoeB